MEKMQQEHNSKQTSGGVESLQEGINPFCTQGLVQPTISLQRRYQQGRSVEMEPEGDKQTSGSPNTYF